MFTVHTQSNRSQPRFTLCAGNFSTSCTFYLYSSIFSALVPKARGPLPGCLGMVLGLLPVLLGQILPELCPPTEIKSLQFCSLSPFLWSVGTRGFLQSTDWVLSVLLINNVGGLSFLFPRCLYANQSPLLPSNGHQFPSFLPSSYIYNKACRLRSG